MSDIVENLRRFADASEAEDLARESAVFNEPAAMREAADEIERLRGRVAHLDAVMRCIDPMAREQLLGMGHQLLAEEANKKAAP